MLMKILCALAGASLFVCGFVSGSVMLIHTATDFIQYGGFSIPLFLGMLASGVLICAGIAVVPIVLSLIA